MNTTFQKQLFKKVVQNLKLDLGPPFSNLKLVLAPPFSKVEKVAL
jgi:hypothetical protein